MAMTDPPITRWFGADEKHRRPASRYWLIDPLVGFYNTTLHFGMRLLSIDACSNLGAFLSLYSPFVFRDSDARARRVWAKLRPDESAPASVDAAMRRLWRCVGRTMAEFSVVHRLWDAGRISVEGVDNLKAARGAGRSILLAPLHLGNWEAAMAAVVKVGFAGSGIYLPLDNRFDTRLAVKTRHRYGAELVPAGPNALKHALRVLRGSGNVFAILIDEFVRDRVQAPAFGRALKPESNIGYVARLASMTDAAVIPVYCVRLNDSARFKVCFLPPVDIVHTGNRDADVIENAGRINAIIEPIIRRHLDQWYFLLDLDLDAKE